MGMGVQMTQWGKVANGEGARMKRIELIQAGQGWMAAHYVDGRPNAEIVKHFGTHILPTAFTALAPKDKVVRTIQALNMDSFVAAR